MLGDVAATATRTSAERDEVQNKARDQIVQRQDTMEKVLSETTAKIERLSQSVDMVVVANQAGNDGRALLSGPDPKLPSPLHRAGESVHFDTVSELDASIEAGATEGTSSPARVLR